MPIEFAPLVVPVGTAVAAIGSATAALRAAAASRQTAAAANAQAKAALGQAAAAEEQARARAEEISLLRARLHREIAGEARADIERGHALSRVLNDAIWLGAGTVDQAATHKLHPSSVPAVQAFLQHFRELMRTHGSQLAMYLGLDSDEWAGLQYAEDMLRNVELSNNWLGYPEFYEKHRGFFILLRNIRGRIYNRMAEQEKYLRPPLSPPVVAK